MPNNYRGSEWRKWDLHFHTPSSFDYKNKSVTNEQIIEKLAQNKISVVAITDHHTIDIERIQVLQELGAQRDITVLPGIELRSELGGSESIHFIGIFPEDGNLTEIWTSIKVKCKLMEADLAQKGNEGIFSILKEASEAIRENGGIVSVHAGSKVNTIENITNALSHKMATKLELLQHIDIFELGKLKDQTDYLNIVLPSISRNVPLVICSDNHNINNYVLKTGLWIKAEPTFNGLKQIIFEPKHRVFWGEYPPFKPTVWLKKLAINFPETAKIENESFCFAGSHEVLFSPYFNCLIGGRGTGKSTLLNLIQAKISPGENEFFRKKNLHIVDQDVKLDIPDFIDIGNEVSESVFEFYGQNEIEKLALDQKELTKAIYKRIKKLDDNGEIKELEIAIIEHSENMTKQIKNLLLINKKRKALEKKISELDTTKAIIESYGSEEYTTLTQNIKIMDQEFIALEKSRINYHNLTNELNSFVQKYEVKDSQNLYDKLINQQILKIKGILKQIDDENLDELDSLMTQKENELTKLRDELKRYLQSKGVSEESLYDISLAHQTINQIEMAIKEIKAQISIFEAEIRSYAQRIGRTNAEKYEQIINQKCSEINAKLSGVQSRHVKAISISYEMDETKMKKLIFDEFKTIFDSEVRVANFQEQYLNELLFVNLRIEELVDIELDLYLEKLNKLSTQSKAKTWLKELFGRENMFKLFKMLLNKHLFNPIIYKMLSVSYDFRKLETTSFGQRCTAALIILLLLGNTPIIIDEPEAHLDSALISNFLVELIKEKKHDRQIIFASHNANFVINGDSELIQILSLSDDGITQIERTSIENESTRKQLIELDGGEEAFIKREKKYKIKANL